MHLAPVMLLSLNGTTYYLPSTAPRDLSYWTSPISKYRRLPSYGNNHRHYPRGKIEITPSQVPTPRVSQNFLRRLTMSNNSLTSIFLLL